MRKSHVNYTEMKRLYETTDKSNEIIASRLGCDTSTVSRWASANYDAEHTKARGIRIKQLHYGDIKGLHNGYALMRKPDWFTGCAAKHGLIFVHIAVYCQANGLNALPAGMVIHHRDHNRLNNNLDNLEMVTRGEHTTHHHKRVPNALKGPSW